MKLGMTVGRVLIGSLMFGHGTQKLFGWFGGHGPEGTGQFLESLGLRPGKRNAMIAGAAEAGGGALMALGLLQPLASAAVTGAMTTAIATAHARREPWVAEGGWEYNAVLVGAAFALVDDGPGPVSLDALRGRERWGVRWALAQLAAGVGAAALALAQRRRHAPEEPASTAASDQPSGGDAGAATTGGAVASGDPSDPSTMPSAN